MGQYGNIYYEFRDFQERRYKVEFFDTDGSVESFEIKNAPPEPISINRVGGNKDGWDDSVILAQQLTFRFYVDYNDLQVIDPILCSPYRQWGAKVTLLDPIELQIFRGYLKTENCIRRYDPEPRNAVKVELCAVDGLAELKDVDFKNYIPTGEQDYPGIITLLRAVKSAVTPLALQLPFLVKVSTYEENYMNPSDCVLEKVYCNLSRFYKGAKGDIYTEDVEFISCYDVIEYVLKPFNCKLFVTPEYFCIVNFYEKNGGYHFRYGWDLILDETQGPYAPETGVSDVTNYFFKTDAELQKIQPLRSILVEVNNNDEGETPQDLGDDGAWTYTGWSSHSSDDGVLELKMTDMGQPHMVLNTPLDLIVHPGNEVLRVQFSYRLTSYVEDKKSESQLQMVVRIQKPTGVWTDVVRSAENAYPKDTWQRFDSYVSNLFFLRGDGEYNVLIGLDSKTGGKHFKSLTLEIKDIKLSQYNVTTGYSFDPLFREVGRQFYQTNGDWHSFEDVKTSLYLFDAEVISDDGALLVIDGGQIKTTSQWNPYGESLQISIVDLFSRNILVNRSIYKDYIRMNIVDRNYVIQHENLLKISNCIFVQNSYDRAYQLMFLEVELTEIISGSDTYHPYDQVNGGNRKTYADYSPIVEVTGEDKLPTFQPQYIEETKDIFNIGFEEEVHGFNIGDVIRAEYDEFGVLKYAKAKADTKEHAKVIGIVTEVVDEYEFKYAAIGKYIGRELLEENIGSGDFEILEGSFYYLSATEDGRITDKPTFEETGVEVVVGIGTDLGLKVANIPKEVDMAAASSVGIPIYMHWENSDVEESDSYTEESLESADSSGYVYYPSDYDKALLELPSDIDCVYGVNIKESSGETLIKKFITEPNVPNTTFLAGGIWFFQTYIRCSSIIGLSIKICVYKRDEFGVETELFSFTQELDDDSETPKSYKYAFVGDNYILKKTDRLVFAYCAINSKEIFQSIELFVESITPTNVRVPFSIDLLATEIGGLTEIETDKSVQGTGKESDPITLVNDEEDPGNDKYYGTDDSGEKGFHDLPEEFNPLEVIEGAITNIEYGGLYNHYAIQDIRNMAPVGWHVATDSDWDALITAVGGNFVAGGVLKEVDTKYWYAPNVDATNEYGFNARGSGGRIDLDGSYSSIRVFGRYWGANVTPVEYQISYNTASVLKTTYYPDDKQYGFAVRWVKDDSTDPGVIEGNDGKVYPTIKIGSQVWTACNVLETRFSNGDAIDGPFFGDSEWIALETPAYCVYDDEPDNASTGKVDIIHNNTKNIQGGTSGERYHHTKDEIGTHVYEANIDGKQYARKDGTWVEVEAGGGGIDDIYIEPDPTFPIDLYKEVDSVQTLITDIPKADGVVAGGHVSWLGGLSYQLDPSAYYKAGDLYTIDTATLTLDAADATYPRIDVLVVNVAEEFTFVKGTPAVNPQKPTINPLTEIDLGAEVYVAAGATEPEPVPTNEIIYNENIEWTATGSGVVINADSTAQHYQGSKSIDVGSIGNFDYIQFQAGETFNTADWENIIANLMLKAKLDTRKARLSVVFLLNDVAINNPTDFTIDGTKALAWQNLLLPFSRIVFFGEEFNQIRFYFYKSTGGDITGFYLDYIKLEIGIEQPPVVNTSVQLIGDVLANGYTGTPITTNLKVVNSNIGTFGDATNVPKITVDGKGRVTAIENVAVTIPPAISPTSDATPVDTDEVVSLRGTSWLKTTWTVLKAFLKTYFDSIYSAINHTHTFVSLTDTPASYSGAGGKMVAVNSGATALEFVDAPSGGGAMSIIDHSTGAFTLALTDAGNYLTCNYPSGFAVTVPKNSVVAFPVGTTICLEQTGNGAITMSPVDVDVTLVAYDGLTSYGQYAVLTIVKKGTDLWTVIAGTGY